MGIFLCDDPLMATEIVSISLPPELAQELKKLAFKEKRSVSMVSRIAIENHINAKSK